MKTFYLPPLHDHHSHFSLYAALSSMPSLADISERAEAIDIIRGRTSREIKIIQGWNSSAFTLIPEDLGDRTPVILLNLSLHGMIINRPAQEFLASRYGDIAANHADPLWVEKNLSRILRMIPCISPPADKEVKSFSISLREKGIAATEDMLLPEAGWLDIISSSAIPVYPWADEEVYRTLTPAERGKVKGVKLFTDGALGTCTAALSSPYIQGGTGILLIDSEHFINRAYSYMKEGIPLAVHAIGDQAVDMVVKAVKILRNEMGCSGPVRIEHAQFISKESAFTAKDEGITISMQPNFSTDSEIYIDRLPRGFAALNNPFRMLIDTAGFIPGKDLIFGSDGMPHGLEPALQAALFPPFQGQVLTIPEFIDAYCMKEMDDEWGVELEDTGLTLSLL